jgi:ABC-type nitrate/sulfonate/bicarbonate transport system substrate-binding protein
VIFPFYTTKAAALLGHCGRDPYVFDTKLIWAFLFSVSLLLASAVSARAQDKTAPEKVRIAIATSSLAFMVPFVAKERGLYLKHGSDVELIQMRPNISIAALLSGQIDYIELIGSAIRSAARGLPIRAVSTGIKAPFFSIIGQHKYKNINDLKGAVIGLTSIGGTNHISTRMTLRQFGFDPDKDVKFLAIGDEKVMFDAFKAGRADVVVLAPPFSVQLKREGFPILAQTAQHVTIPFSGLGTTIDRIQKNRAQIKRVLKAEIEAMRFIQTNAAGTTEVIRKRFNMDERLARESYDVVVGAFSPDGRVPLEGVDILLQIEKDQKLIPATVTPQMVVEPSLVEEALTELGGK